MKRWIWVILVIIVLAVAFILLRMNEDTWIKDSRGVWIKHGEPKDKPSAVTEQENLLSEAYQSYLQAKNNGVDFSSGPCLGTIQSDWSVDIAHEPRQEVDNKTKNQCQDYINGKTKNFIELDESGIVIKIK